MQRTLPSPTLESMPTGMTLAAGLVLAVIAIVIIITTLTGAEYGHV